MAVIYEKKERDRLCDHQSTRSFKCHSADTTWTKLSGRGRVFSFIVFRTPYHESYRNDIPYAVAIIQLDEGPRMESNLIAPDLEELRIDMPVEVFFDDVTEEVSLPKFRPSI